MRKRFQGSDKMCLNLKSKTLTEHIKLLKKIEVVSREN